MQGKVLPGTLNLESWIRGVFNRIRLNTIEYVHGESFVLKHKEETYDLQALPRSHEPTPCLPKAETEQTGVGTWGGVPYIYINNIHRFTVPSKEPSQEPQNPRQTPSSCCAPGRSPPVKGRIGLERRVALKILVTRRGA